MQFGLHLSDATGSIAKGIIVGRKVDLVPLPEHDMTATQLFHRYNISDLPDFLWFLNTVILVMGHKPTAQLYSDYNYA